MSLRPHRTYQRFVQLELNEISTPVIRSLCARGELPNFARILREWACLESTSEEEYELIEPWIQWVTAHTGKTFAEHGIFHLGNQADLKHQQIWELLSEHGIISTIVGSMNARRGAATEGIFIPDPWAKTDETYPPALAPLWRLFSRKVQQHATQPLKVGDLVSGATCCLRLGLPVSIYVRIAGALVAGKLNPKKKWRLAGVFDELLTEIFLAVSRRDPARYYTLFLNSVAHYQHHYWRNFDRSAFNQSVVSPDCDVADDPVLEGYRNFDRLVGRVLARFKGDDTLFVIASGLSQEPYLAHEAEGGMNYYRLKDHGSFATSIGLGAARVLPLMSRDWRVECADAAELAVAERTVGDLWVDGVSLFQVRRDGECSLFLETAVTGAVGPDAVIKRGDGSGVAPFHTSFVNIAVKSGHHTGVGALWVSDRSAVEGSARVPLTELFGFTAGALGVGTGAVRAAVGAETVRG